MTRLSIVHKTAYKYNGRVTLSYNEARMTPLTDGQQVVLEASLKVSPHQASVSTYRDYWGTRVTAFDMQMPHENLEVLATATVEVHRTERVATEDDIVGWDVIASEKVQDEFSDWLPQSRLSGPGEEVLEIVPDVVKGKNPHEAALAVFAWMAGEMTYMKGTTGVTTNAEQAWSQRQGVCQDLAHLAIGALRCSGIPARYVSGYIHPRSSADIGETVAGQSHAWLEWWDGEWRSWDPTNHKPAGDYHVTVARGRDYRDVPPLKGILSGGGGSGLSVSVEITRLA
ncbi:transglutaminase family protein [Arthrobacter sp. ISL-95]|uniref:transglutaminase family protein n=1 Tax=Arthrobacter sp. ISL-95 TaxID=2819116 RepID=UPI001BEC3CBF|nr:transglutaminase family protein [Arthrobacter sp. ISL-95]MBT2587271.1 transglutaminase family protein [Arthrobacter sp. ISL-95]